MSGPRKPTKLRLIEGNRGKRALPTNEPQPKNEKHLISPIYLSANALDEWRRVAPELHRLGLLTSVDISALGAYCMAYARWLEAEKDVSENGIRFGDKKNPACTVVDTSLKQMRAYANEFGLTPAARPKLSIKDKGVGGTDPWS